MGKGFLSVVCCFGRGTVLQRTSVLLLKTSARDDTSSSIHCACLLAMELGHDCIPAVLLSFGDVKVQTGILSQLQPHLLTSLCSPPLIPMRLQLLRFANQVPRITSLKHAKSGKTSIKLHFTG